MKKELIIERLEATIKMLEGLKPEEFRYDKFVSKTDDDRTCGTMCCVAGWYPKYFPEAGLVWKHSLFASGGMNIVTVEGSSTMVDEKLIEYHGLKYSVIMGLFYGCKLIDEVQTILPNVSDWEDMHNITLLEVIDRFKTVLEVIKTTDEYNAY